MLGDDTLNLVMTSFSVALDGAFAALHVYALGLLGTLAFLYYGLHMGWYASRSYSSDALAELLWTVLQIGAFYFLLTVLYDLLWNRAFPTFVQWGAEASGGTFTAASFMNPAAVLRSGFEAAYPIKVFVDQFIGITAPFYAVDITLAMLAYVLTLVAFAAITLALMVTVIEFKLGIATSSVLIPWAILRQTATLGELSFSWLFAGLVRVLMTVIMAGIAVPLFQVLAIPLSTAGVDPQVHHTIALPIVAVVFAVLAWVVPNRASGFAGRGMALALTGEHVIQGGMGVFSGMRASARMAGEAIHGVSRLRHAA